jgi:uncharacterized protein YbjT (DUF2867 family)
VSGASGFVGSLLVPRLAAAGLPVRASGRDPERVREALDRNMDSEDVDIVRADALMGEGLDRALDGVRVAYYLIHSLERPVQGRAPFNERDRLAAENFASAARRSGVERIVYLGGLLPQSVAPPGASGEDLEPAPRGSRHLSSRLEVERILMAGLPGSVALRASIVVGARSRSFRLLVHLLERMPVLALPGWRNYRTQPIDQRDVIEMLYASASAPVAGRTLDLGGPEALTYGEMLERIAQAMLVSRPALPLGVHLTSITARLAAAIASEDPDLVLPLMEGLRGDLLPTGEDAAELLGVRLHSFDAAVERALAEWEEFEPLAAR